MLRPRRWERFAVGAAADATYNMDRGCFWITSSRPSKQPIVETAAPPVIGLLYFTPRRCGHAAHRQAHAAGLTTQAPGPSCGCPSRSRSEGPRHRTRVETHVCTPRSSRSRSTARPLPRQGDRSEPPRFPLRQRESSSRCGTGSTSTTCMITVLRKEIGDEGTGFVLRGSRRAARHRAEPHHAGWRDHGMEAPSQLSSRDGSR